MRTRRGAHMYGVTNVVMEENHYALSASVAKWRLSSARTLSMSPAVQRQRSVSAHVKVGPLNQGER